MKVFLVDDNPIALKMLAYALNRAGYEVATAESGSEALSRIPDERPDVVILDIMMPGMDGFEVVRRLRARSDTARLPIMLLTAKDQVQDKVEGFACGADDYLVKPVMPDELLARINALVRRKQMYEQALQTRRGAVIGFLGVKGGVGTSTLAVNVAVAMAQEGRNVILIDLNQWGRTAAMQLGLIPRAGVSLLTDRSPAEIELRALEGNMERHRSGVRLLALPRDSDRFWSPEQVAAMIEKLEAAGGTVLLDLGSELTPVTREALQRCDVIVVVTEASPTSLFMAQELLDRLDESGLGGGRVRLVVVNRTRSAMTYTHEELEERFGDRLLALIAPAPEICFHADKVGVPILIGQPADVTAVQVRELSAMLL